MGELGTRTVAQGSVNDGQSEGDQRYRAIFDNSRDAMMVVASDGRFREVNPATLQMFESDDTTRFLTLGPVDVSPPFQPDGQPSAQKAAAMLDLAMRKGCHAFEWRHQTLTGREFPAHVMLTRLEFKGEALIQATIRDLTETETALRALRESEQRLRLAVEATQMGTYATDETDGRTSYSPELLALFDLPPSAELRLGPDRLPAAVLDEDRPSLISAMANSHRPESDGKVRAEFRIVREDGSLRWLQVHGRTEFQGEGPARIPVRSAGVLMDITERKRIDEFAAARLRLLEFAADHSLAELLQRTLDEAEALSDSRIGFYHFVESDQTTLSLQAWSTRTLSHFCKAAGHGLHYGIEQAGVWVDCVHARKPIIHNDYASLSHRKGLPAGHAPILRELVVPILREGIVVAVLGVGNKPTDYNEADLRAVAYLADVAWEVTRRKRAEAAVRDSEEQLERIFNRSSNGIVFTDPVTGTIQKVNDTWVAQTGVTRAEAIGQNALELGLWSNPEDRQACIDMFRREGRLRDLEVTLVLRGRERRLAMSAEPIDLGHKRFVLWEARDITETERVARELALLKRSVDVHYDAAYWLDVNNRIVYTNHEGARILGYEPAELLGAALSDVNPGATRERMERVWATLRKDGVVRTSDSIHRHKNGDQIPVEIVTTHVSFSGKEYACGFARDIRARKQADAEKAKLQDQLAHAQKMESVGRLAGGVAHDYNNMLGVILAHAEMALETVDPDNPLHEVLLTIQSAAQRSADLTRQLLTFARRQTVAPKLLNLNETIAGMLNMVRRMVGENIHLEWNPGTGLWLVFIDAVQIDQILANLCVNARDAIRDVGTIVIKTGTRAVATTDTALAEPGDYVWMAVRDDGGGMSEATKARAFEPFFTTKEIGKGTGLGLATVYGIVEQNGGFIELQSQLGEGTTVVIYLPRHIGKTADLTAHPKSDTVGGQETVLLVEDEPYLADVVSRMLKRQGYNVMSANTPREALRLAAEQPGAIDLLITDVVMPEMNGRDLAARVLATCPRAKRLFMSGYTAELIAHQGVLDEGVAFIQKPFTANELAAKVRQALGDPIRG